MIEVDPEGRLGLVDNGRDLRILDLRRLRWVRTGPLPSGPAENYTQVPALTRDAIVHEGPGPDSFAPRVRFTSLAGGQPRHVLSAGFQGMPQVCRDGDRVFWPSSDQKLEIASARADGPARTYDPLPGEVVQAAFVEGDLVAAATCGLIALFRLEEGGRLRDLATFTFEGDVSWVGLGETRLAAVVERRAGLWRFAVKPDGAQLHVWPVGDAETPGRHQVVNLRHVGGKASMSRDGRTAAIAQSPEVHLFDLETGARTTFSGGRADPILVRFTDGDRLLVTADAAGHVFLRPRVGDTACAGDVVEARVPDDPVPLANSPAAPEP